MTASERHELAKRDRRIAQLEREVERLGNIVSAQADALTKADDRGRAKIRKALSIERHEGIPRDARHHSAW